MADKLFYSMGEVAEMFDVNTSLIRHWESQFSILRPKRNKKGNRLFSPEDVENLKMIYHLVKERGMTLEGAKKALRKAPSESGVDRDAELMERLQRIRALLVEVREDLKAGEGEIVAASDADMADADASAAAAAETLSVTAESAAAPAERTAMPAAEQTSGNRLTADAFATPAPSPIAADRQKRPKEQRFLPTRKRIDREINKLKFAYKGEVMMGLTASYGTLSSDDTDIMLILDGIDADGTVATVKPFIGYFYRDNNCLGVRFGYRHMDGNLDAARYDLGESNDASGSIPKVNFNSDNYSFGIFHRSYAGLDPKGRFGLFAEFELSLSTGTSKLSYQPDTTSDNMKTTLSDNTQLKLAFNPGAAVYIFPNVCATLSFGLGGIQYTSVTQKDDAGNKIGTRKASNMRFRLNVAAINFGMTVHLWDKKKR